LFCLLSTLAYSQEKDTCPRALDIVISESRSELCPEKRLEYVTIYCEKQDSIVVLKGETTQAAVRDSILQRSRRLYPHVRDEVVLLPHPALGDMRYGVVRISTGHLRRQPDHDMEMISQGLMGESVILLKRAGPFYFCKLADGYLGWMEAASLAVMDQPRWRDWQGAEKITYVQGMGLIYSKKNRHSDPVSDIVPAALLIKVKKEGKWIMAKMPDGRTGYVPANEVMDYRRFCDQPHPTGSMLVATAKRFLGHPYLWGGNSAKGFDCSGLVKTVYRLHNIQLPRDANMQVLAGQEVTIDSLYSNLMPGDLLFFGPHQNRITHVAMYIGHGEIIQSDGLVRIDSLDPQAESYNAYRRKGLRAVRRILAQ